MDTEAEQDVQDQWGRPDEGARAAESTMADDDGHAIFLDAVRTLMQAEVHGEKIVAQRTDSDDWSVPSEEPEAEREAAEAPEAPPEPPSTGRAGRRQARRTRSATSRNPAPRGRRRRTVEDAAQEVAPGTEALVDATPAPALEPVTSAEPEPAPEDTPEPSPPAVVRRWERRRAARAVRRAARARDKVGRAQAKAAAEVTRAEVKAATRVARARARASAQVERATTRSRAVRRAVRAEAALATQVARAVVEGAALEPAPGEPETLEEYVARVQAGILPRKTRRTRPRTPRWFRRTLTIGAACAAIAGAAVLPWAAPAVPDLIADLVPDGSTAAPRVEDPAVAPPTNAFTGPVGIKAGPYVGARLRAAGAPREIVVTRLGVQSRVLPISGQSGTLLPPDDPQLLGWWREGKPTGAQFGTAVVTGHTVHDGGGALDHLGRLVKGDAVRVRTDNGWIGYTVQRTQVYSRAELAASAEEVFRLSGPGRLVLITCDDWNGEAYESNAVVVATPVADEPFTS